MINKINQSCPLCVFYQSIHVTLEGHSHTFVWVDTQQLNQLNIKQTLHWTKSVLPDWTNKLISLSNTLPFLYSFPPCPGFCQFTTHVLGLTCSCSTFIWVERYCLITYGYKMISAEVMNYIFSASFSLLSSEKCSSGLNVSKEKPFINQISFTFPKIAIFCIALETSRCMY